MTTDDAVHDDLAARVGEDRAADLLRRIARFTNYPNTIKGIAKLPADPELEAAVFALLQDPAMRVELDLEWEDGKAPLFGVSKRAWGLLTLAARVDPAVLDLVPEPDLEYVARLSASIRRAAKKHAAAESAPPTAPAAPSAAPAAPSASDRAVPARVSEVRAWLAAHPDTDPSVLAPFDGQQPDERRAAIRALGTLATPEALDVLGRYAQNTYSDADMAELNRAWARFDRREFARLMLGRTGTADLRMCKTIEGIGAVPALTSLLVIFDGKADLSPVAECTSLQKLWVGAEGLPGIVDVTPLLSLPELVELNLTRTTHNADLTPLARLSVERLQISLDGGDGSFLLEMPSLKRLLLTGERYDRGGDGAHPGLARVVLELVRAGVEVVVSKYEKTWVPNLLVTVDAADDVFAVERSGRIGLTRDEEALERLERRLASNILP